MSGKLKNIQKYIIGKLGIITRIHCTAHLLNLTVNSPYKVVSKRNRIKKVF